MITGKELKEGMVDVEKEHCFISFSVEEVKDELREYVWAFDPENEECLGNPDVIVSNLWIEEAILEVKDWFSYDYDSWSNIRDLIIEKVVERATEETKTKVSTVSGVLANDSIRGGTTDAS